MLSAVWLEFSRGFYLHKFAAIRSMSVELLFDKDGSQEPLSFCRCFLENLMSHSCLILWISVCVLFSLWSDLNLVILVDFWSSPCYCLLVFILLKTNPSFFIVFKTKLWMLTSLLERRVFLYSQMMLDPFPWAHFTCICHVAVAYD